MKSLGFSNLNQPCWLSYSEPILTEQLVVFCNDKDGKWPDSYTGKGVAINYGFAFPKEIFDLIASKKMTLEHPKDNEQSLKFLYQNKVSCYINDKNSIYYTLKSLNYDSNKVYLKAVIENVDGYLGYSHDKKLFPYGDTFIRKFNSLLLKMKKDGEIEAITKSFLK